MKIGRRDVVGLLEVQTSGGARNVVDDHELTWKFYEQTKVWIAHSAPRALRDASQLYPKKRIIELAYLITYKSYLNTKLNLSRQSRPILDCPIRDNWN